MKDVTILKVIPSSITINPFVKLTGTDKSQLANLEQGEEASVSDASYKYLGGFGVNTADGTTIPKIKTATIDDIEVTTKPTDLETVDGVITLTLSAGDAAKQELPTNVELYEINNIETTFLKKVAGGASVVFDNLKANTYGNQYIFKFYNVDDTLMNGTEPMILAAINTKILEPSIIDVETTVTLVDEETSTINVDYTELDSPSDISIDLVIDEGEGGKITALKGVSLPYTLQRGLSQEDGYFTSVTATANWIVNGVPNSTVEYSPVLFRLGKAGTPITVVPPPTVPTIDSFIAIDSGSQEVKLTWTVTDTASTISKIEASGTSSVDGALTQVLTSETSPFTTAGVSVADFTNAKLVVTYDIGAGAQTIELAADDFSVASGT